MKTTTNGYRGYRFPREIIGDSVLLYNRFFLSFRDVEEILVRQGIVVTYETIRQRRRSSGPSTQESSSIDWGGSAKCGIWTRVCHEGTKGVLT